MPLFNSSARKAVIPNFGKPNIAFNNPNGITGAYKSALEQNAGDYDSIRSGYENMLSTSNSPKTFQSRALTPTFRNYMGDSQYQSSPEYNQTMEGLSEFARTGGYSDDDISNLRARGTAPIRSAYATALKELNRNKSLQGGYAPGHGAALAKFAREKGYLLSDKATDINAGIAERVAQNKLSSLSTLAPLQARENENRNRFNESNLKNKMAVEDYNTNLINEFNKMNQDEEMRINQLNMAEEQRAIDNQNRALSGMSSIYSASPGLVNTFGNQVLSDRNQVLNNNAQRSSQGLNLIRSSGMNIPRFGRG